MRLLVHLKFISPEISKLVEKGIFSHHARGQTLADTLGFYYIYLSNTHLVIAMKVDSHVFQPFGLLHGGVNVCLSEEVCSFGSSLFYTMKYNTAAPVVGMEINANHLRSAAKGYVLAIGSPLHTGRKTNVWNCNLYNVESASTIDDISVELIEDLIQGRERRDCKLICVSRCTTAVLQNSKANSDKERKSHNLQSQEQQKKNDGQLTSKL